MLLLSRGKRFVFSGYKCTLVSFHGRGLHDLLISNEIICGDSHSFLTSMRHTDLRYDNSFKPPLQSVRVGVKTIYQAEWLLKVKRQGLAFLFYFFFRHCPRF